MNKLVSIIIPVFNRASLVSRAIESSVNQTYTNIEIIIGDNCSTDGSWEIIKEFAKKDERIIIFKNDNNIGPVGNWIECLKRTKGEFIKFIFSDDWIDIDWIEKAISPLKNNKRIGFSFTPANIVIDNQSINVSFKWFEKSRIISSDYYIFLNFFKKNAPVSPGCALFRRQDVIKNLFTNIKNPLNIDYSKHGGGIDLLLFLFTAKEYKHIAYVDNTMAYFLGSDDSFTINQNLTNAYLYSKIYFMNNYKVFSLFFWLKLFWNKSELIKLLRVKVTLKELKALPYLLRN